MADYDLKIKLPQPTQNMSLGDMVNLAGNIQNYQQKQITNPLLVQKAQQDVQQAGIKTEQDQMALQNARYSQIIGSQVSLINNPLIIKAEQNPKSLTNDEKISLNKLLLGNGMNTAIALGIPQDQAMKSLQPVLEVANTDPSQLRETLKNRHIQTLDAASRTSALTPSGVAVNYGTGGQVSATNPFGGVAPGAAIPGTAYRQGLAPTVATGPTGAPMEFGGAGGGITNTPAANQIVPRPMSPQAVQPAAPMAANQPAQNAVSGLGSQFNAKGGLQIAPSESYDAFRARSARLSGLPVSANNALNMANVESIPNQEYTNNKIIKLLENKDVDVGPIAQSIANKTGGVGLTADQQEVMKYLEQRIRQESARSNQDQASQRSAFGSFGTSKPALLDIIYNDKGNLASQRLYNQGILKYQGNPNQPNLGAINDFENKFNQLNQDPNVTHLIGIIGNKSMEQLSNSDKQHLKKYFSGMSQDQINSIFEKKQQLEDLVHGGK